MKALLNVFDHFRTWSLQHYNYATITNLDPVGFGLSGVYSAFNILGGIAYHF